MRDFRDILVIIGTATAIIVGVGMGVFLTSIALEAFVESLFQ